VILGQEGLMAGEARGNGETDALPPASDGPQLFINFQYTKDLSFENPRAPQSLIQQAAPPEVAINVDVKARNLNPEAYEVVLTINVTANVQAEPVFLVELAYAAVVTVRNAPEPVLTNLVLIETPRIIFPFARSVIANATRDGGFPPLLINPIDFAELLRRQQSPEQPAATEGGRGALALRAAMTLAAAGGTKSRAGWRPPISSR
jgi:preprotein translocase subunit SecB